MNALVESLQRLYNNNKVTKEKVMSLTSISKEEKEYILNSKLSEKDEILPIDISSLLK